MFRNGKKRFPQTSLLDPRQRVPFRNRCKTSNEKMSKVIEVRGQRLLPEREGEVHPLSFHHHRGPSCEIKAKNKNAFNYKCLFYTLSMFLINDFIWFVITPCVYIYLPRRLCSTSFILLRGKFFGIWETCLLSRSRVFGFGRPTQFSV